MWSRAILSGGFEPRDRLLPLWYVPSLGGGPVLSVMADGPPRFDDEGALGVYRSSDWGERAFCKICGSSILWRSVDGKFQSIPAALLGDLDGFAFTSEIFVDDKPAYYSFAGERTRMTGAEVMATVGGDTDQ